MAETLEVQAVRCLKCRRYLCGVIGYVEVKCPSCKEVNKVAAGDIGRLAERTGYAPDDRERGPPNTRKEPARRKNAGSGTG
jgi:phage FluMu protein Com